MLKNLNRRTLAQPSLAFQLLRSAHEHVMDAAAVMSTQGGVRIGDSPPRGQPLTREQALAPYGGLGESARRRQQGDDSACGPSWLWEGVELFG